MGIAESTRDACFYQSSFTIIYTVQLHFMRKKVLHLKFFKQSSYFNFSVSETKQYKWRYSIGPEALCWNPDLHLVQCSHYHHLPFILVQKRTTTTRNADIINAECRKGNQLSITKDYTFKDVKSYLCLTIILEWVGSLSLLQRIFPTQGSHPGLPHCTWILYQLSHK